MSENKTEATAGEQADLARQVEREQAPPNYTTSMEAMQRKIQELELQVRQAKDGYGDSNVRTEFDSPTSRSYRLEEMSIQRSCINIRSCALLHR